MGSCVVMQISSELDPQYRSVRGGSVANSLPHSGIKGRDHGPKAAVRPWRADHKVRCGARVPSSDRGAGGWDGKCGFDRTSWVIGEAFQRSPRPQNRSAQPMSPKVNPCALATLVWVERIRCSHYVRVIPHESRGRKCRCNHLIVPNGLL
jgi:hypothetical protein